MKLLLVILMALLSGCPFAEKRDPSIYKWGELPGMSGSNYAVCKREGSSEMFKCPDYIQPIK